MATEQDIEDQQRRVVVETKQDVQAFLEITSRLQARGASYARLGLAPADPEILDDGAFSGTGTGKDEYRAAVGSIDALATWLASGHGTNLEKFAR